MFETELHDDAVARIDLHGLFLHPVGLHRLEGTSFQHRLRAAGWTGTWGKS